MRANELIYDEKNSVYLNPDKVISYSDGERNENYIFDSLKNSKDTSIFSMELFERIHNWSSEYHFTTYRANIIRPLNITKNQKILEIGAGTGAITRYLGETGATITAVEGSLSRARCIAERCRDLDNVKVICSNIEDVEFDEKFDVITLIGVFEYTAKYSDKEDPFNAALKYYSGLLNQNGSLVIAIENKLGLKYFSGFNEDHFITPYFGLESRYGQRDITTFGRRELKGMLLKGGFQSTNFLYPFPDYKLPKVVITENGLENKDFNATDLIRFTKDRHYHPRPKASNMNEYLVWEALGENALLKDLSNSFLIVAGKSNGSELIRKSLLAEYYTCNRFEPHNTVTSFVDSNGEIKVEKAGIGVKTKNEGKAVIPQKIEDRVDYFKGNNLHHKIYGALQKKHFSNYEKMMGEWVDFLKRETLLEKGAHQKVRPEYYDALPFNIIIDEKGDYHLFDQEWKINEQFDITFLVVRYLSPYKRKKELRRGYAKNFHEFVNSTLQVCNLKTISKGALKDMQAMDEEIRSKINRPSGIAPLQLKRSLAFLALNKLREIKQSLYSGSFAQR